MDADGTTLDIYWRRGCGFCSRLLRRLEAAGVEVTLHDIWADDRSREFVRRHNGGDETVPTVALGGAVWTNPSAEEVIAEVERSHRHLLPPRA